MSAHVYACTYQNGEAKGALFFYIPVHSIFVFFFCLLSLCVAGLFARRRTISALCVVFVVTVLGSAWVSYHKPSTASYSVVPPPPMLAQGGAFDVGTVGAACASPPLALPNPNPPWPRLHDVSGSPKYDNRIASRSRSVEDFKRTMVPIFQSNFSPCEHRFGEKSNYSRSAYMGLASTTAASPTSTFISSVEHTPVTKHPRYEHTGVHQDKEVAGCHRLERCSEKKDQIFCSSCLYESCHGDADHAKLHKD